MTSRAKIVSVAKSYIGTCGGSSAHADILHYFNEVKPYGYTAHKSDPWCAIFVSACAIQAFGKETAKKYFPLSAACTYIINEAEKDNIWVESDKYIPEAGDWILYDWDDNGKGDNKGQPDHVGLVEYYKAGYIHVIEGNMGAEPGRCGRRKLSIDGRYIRGFVTPDYDRIRVSKNDKTTEEIAKEVIAGKWGNGSERVKKLKEAGYDPDAVQKKVNELLTPKKSIDEIAKEVLDGKWGNGSERVKKLKDAGYDPDAVQKRVNELLAVNKIGACANEYAYTTNTSKASYKSGYPTAAYKSALDKAYPDRSKWGKAPRAGASCDVFVGTCVRNAGIDKDFPRGLADQIPYLAKSAKFKQVSVTVSTAKDGDIIVYTKTAGGGHICIVYDGKIKEAGFESYYPKTTDYLKQRLSKSGKKMLKVYRVK